MQSYAGSDPGKRENNEDAVWADDKAGLYIVIDGMGGHRAGEHAAQIARDVLSRRLTAAGAVDAHKLKESITEANNEIYAAAQRAIDKTGMGCVLTVAVIQGNRLLIGHVGDTRLYRIQGGDLKKLTRDHSSVGDMEAQGLLTEEEARRHPQRHRIYRDVGLAYRDAEEPEFIDVHEETFSPDAALLLCSDGLMEAVSSAEICSIVYHYAGHPERAVKELIRLAKDRGGKDNISVIVAEAEGFARAARAEVTQRHSKVPILKSIRPNTHRWRRVLIMVLGVAVLTTGLMMRDRLKELEVFKFFQHQPRELVVQAGGYGSIAEALEHAHSGDTVKVTAGVYHETVHLRNGVHMLSAGKVELAPTQFPAIVAEKLDHGTLQGFEISAPEGRRFDSAAILISDANIVISECRIDADTRIGIEVRGAAKPTIMKSAIANHEIGILIYGAAEPKLQANQINRNGIGILAAERSRPAIFENHIAENHKREVIIEATSAPARFDGNVIGYRGVELRNPEVERTLDPKGHNIYMETVHNERTKK